MNNLVFVQKDVPYTDSLAIASGGNVEHRAILQLIKTHLDDLQEFGRVSFEMRPFPPPPDVGTNRNRLTHF